MREDYSPHGNAWEYLPHDHARSRAYRWGEDGIAGHSATIKSRLCFSLALWNGRDPILKERLFGLTNSEGNHGEDVKELYYYLDATPTHSYLKMLYKYPQAEFPYARLVDENRRRGKDQPEFELLDTGVFDDDRYFDVFVEYAKARPDDILMRVTVHNRGPDEATHPRAAATLVSQHLVVEDRSAKPSRRCRRRGSDHCAAITRNSASINFVARKCRRAAVLRQRDERPTPVRPMPTRTGYFKDAFHEYLIEGKQDAVNPEQQRHQSRGALRVERFRPAARAKSACDSA